MREDALNNFRRLGGGAAILAMLALPAGCGKESDSKDGEAQTARATATAERVDPCSFITPGEVTAITTDAVIRATASGNDCTYHADPDDGVQVTVHVHDGVKQMQIVRRSAAVAAGMGRAVAGKGRTGADVGVLLSEDKTALPELGDEAMWGLNTTLSVRKGDFFVSVTPPIMHDPMNHGRYPLVSQADRRAIAQQVAEKILSRAPR
jgi:hypothetical protein